METKFTPGPWFADQDGNIWRRNPAELYQNGGGVAGDKPLAAARRGWTDEGEIGYPAKDNARLIAAAPELFEALTEYASAEAMPTYGDSSDFVWPKIEMQQPGQTAWVWICEKHGLGYQSGCICCRDDFDRHGERKDREARSARDDALRSARDKARAALAKATGDQP